MFTVDKNQLSVNKYFEYTAFASDLGWKPGVWPAEFEVTGFGNKLSFYPIQVTNLDQSDGFVLYMQEFGAITIKIYND